ncbi:hypothetical protein MRB53_037314 [Persea americana]|nr:hypothetical protein MRB53_037314 [Persea americana]
MPLVNGHRYYPTTAILLSEVIKLAVSLSMALYTISYKHSSSTTTAAALFGKPFAVASSPLMPGRWSFPQSSSQARARLQYVAAGHVNAYVFQAAFQLKLLAAAAFSFLLLGRTLNGRKLSALALIAGSVFLVVARMPQAPVALTLAQLRGGG